MAKTILSSPILIVTIAAAIGLSGCATRARDRLRGVELSRWTSKITPQEPKQEPLPELNESSTVRDYLVYAALNNPGLKATFEEWKAAVQRVPQAESLPDPKVSYEYAVQSDLANLQPMQQKVGLTQEFPFYGKRRLKGGAGAEAANAALDRYESARLDLAFRVQDAYYEFYYLRHALDVLNSNIDLLNKLKESVRVRYQAGQAANADLLKLQLELDNLANEKASLEDLREPTVAKLNAVLNRPQGAPLAWPSQIVESPPQLDEPAMLQRLVEANPKLKALTDEIEKAQFDVEIARKEYYPDFMFGLEYMANTERNMTSPGEATVPGQKVGLPAMSLTTTPLGGGGGTPQSVTIPAQRIMIPEQKIGIPPATVEDNYMLGVMISFNVPIWYGRLSAGVKEAQSMLEAAAKSKTDKENELLSELKMALYKFRNANRQVGLYREALIPRAEQSLRAMQASYMGGTGSFADLIDTQRMLLEFNLSYHRAIADRLQRLAEVEMLVGAPALSLVQPSTAMPEGGAVAAP